MALWTPPLATPTYQLVIAIAFGFGDELLGNKDDVRRRFRKVKVNLTGEYTRWRVPRKVHALFKFNKSCFPPWIERAAISISSAACRFVARILLLFAP